MTQITQKKWELLSQTERELAKAMGITPKVSKTGTRSRPKSDPKPYVIQTKIHCILCKSKTVQFFHMEVKMDQDLQPYLQSREVTEREAQYLRQSLPCDLQKVTARTCSACVEVLEKWSREELTDKLIKASSDTKSVNDYRLVKG